MSGKPVYPPRPKGQRECAWCGQHFGYHPKMRIKYCSRTCGYHAKAKPFSVITWRECIRCEAPFVGRGNRRRCDACIATIGVQDKQLTATCEQCNNTFTYTWRTNRRRFCSKKCRTHNGRTAAQRRLAKDRRSARKRLAYVEDVWRSKVYERDHWRCQLCGKCVERDAVVPHPLAPTLDHIVPLAAGGTHEYANVQTAHFLCNSLKGDRGCDQLRLIG